MPKSKDQKFKVFYHISNNGDGSASTHFHKTKEEAKKADEEMSEPWGEPCNGSLNLKIENGKLYFQHWDENYKQVWSEALPNT